jgi:putative FmdB family regulatory protein
VPTYEYRCVSCEHQFERFQRMSDDPVSECEVCGQAVKRLLFPVAIHFKGSGFYSTDYARRNTMGSAGASSGNSSSSEGSSSDSGGESGPSSSAAGATASTDTSTEKSSGSAGATAAASVA